MDIAVASTGRLDYSSLHALCDECEHLTKDPTRQSPEHLLLKHLTLGPELHKSYILNSTHQS